MNQDLKWLAEKVTEWNGSHGYIGKRDQGAYWMHVPMQRECFTQSEWQAARDELLSPEIGVVESFLGSPFSTHEEDEVEKRDEMTAARTQYIADVSRKAMAGVIDGLSPATDPFSNEDEDEEWEKIERRMDLVGLNGPTGCHYNAGEKHDAGKPAMHLIPANIEVEVSRVLQFGAEKYGPENWRLVPDLRTRYMGAAMRHVNAMRQGYVLDEESGLHHAAHAICCLMFIGETEMTAGPE